MDNEEFLMFLYKCGINDVIIENNNEETVLRNSSDKVIITGFNFAFPLIKAPKFMADLRNNLIDSNLLIKIIKAYRIAATKYIKAKNEYVDNNNKGITLSNDTLINLASMHFDMAQAYTYLNPDIQKGFDELEAIIKNPITVNDHNLNSAYLRKLSDYELDNGGGMTNSLRRDNITYYEDDLSGLGFISIAGIVLIIINLGIIIATYIINH